MPPLSTHFRLATLVMPRMGITSNVSSFLLGTTAPDAFDPESEESFSQHHFNGKDGRISLENFLRETNFTFSPDDNSSGSFNCGYYCHLWLDVFFRDNADRLPFKKSLDMTDMNFRDLVRKETEILNAPFVLGVGNLSLPRSEDLLMQIGLEFVSVERCTYLFSEVVKQSQAWSQLVPTFEALDKAEYDTFFEDVSKLFINKLQNAG